VKLPPHPTLPEYYGTTEARQRFVNELFDRTAPWYLAIDRATAFGMGPSYRRQALRRAGLRAGMWVLDVGCGPGLTARGAMRLAGATGYVVGLDPSDGMLKEARRSGCPALVQGVGEELPFPDARFDFVSMGYALRHVSDLDATFREYRRVLRPGGILLLLEVSRPRSAMLRSVSRFYIRTVVGLGLMAVTANPHIRTLMRYWWDTTESCAAPTAILSALEEAGFVEGSVKERFNGFFRDYRAVKG
jgi:demethylmenaquinone methyltransferase / 2-methoxy-6-polyprenyl-1,4-benzoquinol methylase